MTLIVTIANKKGLFQTSDYQITLEGKFVTDAAGTKQIELTFGQKSIIVTFTGAAYFNIPKMKTIDFLRKELMGLPQKLTLHEICKQLAVRCEKNAPSNQKLTLVMGVATLGKPFRLAIISNTDWNRNNIYAKNHFKISIRKITKPLISIEGHRKCLSKQSRKRLKLLSQISEKSAEQILNSMIEINSISAKNSKGYVSEKCWATSFIADGQIRRGLARNVGGNGAVSGIFGGIDIAEWIKQRFRTIPGKEIGIVQKASVVSGPGDLKPIPPPEGAPREFTISGQGVAGIIISPTKENLASFSFTPLATNFILRCNESKEGPFAEVEIAPLGYNMVDFPLSYPSIQINPIVEISGIPISTPDGWDQPIECYVENGVCNIIFPTTTRGGIRNTSFLSNDDEMVIIFPVTPFDFSFVTPGPPTRKILDCRIIWRKRLDNTFN